MFVIVLKEFGRLYCYSSLGIDGPIFDSIYNFKNRSGFSAFIFYSEIEAKHCLESFPKFHKGSIIEIVPLHELQAKIQEFFS